MKKKPKPKSEEERRKDLLAVILRSIYTLQADFPKYEEQIAEVGSILSAIYLAEFYPGERCSPKLVAADIANRVEDIMGVS